MKTAKTTTAVGTPVLMAGFNHIIDDGVSDADHGYLIPKSAAIALKAVGNSGIAVIDVPPADLRKALVDLGARQKARLAAATA